MTNSKTRERIYAHYVTAAKAASDRRGVENLATRAPALRHIVRHYFPRNSDAAILDLGCGNGALLHFVREAGYCNVRGVDISAEQVEMARRLGITAVEQANLVEALVRLPESSQDVVIALDVIEHLTKDELLNVVDSVFRVLKTGGCWIIHAPNGESPFVGAVRYGDITHEQAFTRGSLQHLLRASGFGAVECYESAPVVHGVTSLIRACLWALLRLVLRVALAVETGDTGRSALFTRNLLAVATK